jgi:hypothetical protein
MSLSEDPIIPSEPPPPRENLSAAQRGRRRRVTRREMIPMDAEGQAELIGSLAKRAFPSIELFVFSLACGAILGLGFMLDSQAVLLLGILLAPLMVPWVGFLLSILTGSPRFLFETSMALLISIILIFIGGVLTGFCMRLFLPHTLTNLYTHARLWIPELLVIAIGAVTLVASFIRSESRPFLPSVIIAYGFFLPVSAAGFGLGSGLPGVWPLGIYVSIVHVALASLLGLITLFILRIRPTSTGYIFSAVGMVVFIAVLYILMVPGFKSSAAAAVPSTPTLTALPSLTPDLSLISTNTIQPSNTHAPALGLTNTPIVVTETLSASSTPSATPPSVTPVPLTLAITLPSSATPTITLTLEAQSISGKVSAVEGGGANLRQTPNGKYLMTLDNGTIVEIYPDFKIVNGVTWIHVFVTRNSQRVEGWLLESVVTYSTPEPNFDASATPGAGITPVP